MHTDRKSSSTWTDTAQSDNRTTAILFFPPPKHTFKCEVISHYHPEVASFARGSTAPEEAFIRLWKPHNLLSWRHRRHCSCMSPPDTEAKPFIIRLDQSPGVYGWLGGLLTFSRANKHLHAPPSRNSAKNVSGENVFALAFIPGRTLKIGPRLFSELWLFSVYNAQFCRHFLFFPGDRKLGQQRTLLPSPFEMANKDNASCSY